MSSGWGRLPTTDGTSQEGRLPLAMKSGYIRPQERALHDHLVLLRRYAGLIRLPGDAGTPGSSWELLFQREPAFALAEILALRADERRLSFLTELDSDPKLATASLHALADLVRSVRGALLEHGYTELVKQMDRISQHAFALSAASRSRQLVRKVPEPDGAEGDILGRLKAMEHLSPGLQGLTIARERLGLAAIGPDRMSGSGAVSRARAARGGLADAFDLLLNVFLVVRPEVALLLEARLNSGRVDPALGLLISELRLLGEVEDRINEFVDHHTQFYYRTVLGQAPRPAFTETLIMRFLPAAKPVMVEPNVQLVGRVEGAATQHRYRLLHGVRAVPAEIGAACVLVYQRDPEISRQKQLGYVTSILSAQLDADDLGDRPLFTHERLSRVSLGIDVSSGIFALAEGQRKVTVDLEMRLRNPFVMPPSGMEKRAEYIVAAVAAGLRADRALAAAFDPIAEAPAIAKALEVLEAKALVSASAGSSTPLTRDDTPRGISDPPASSKGKPPGERALFWRACMSRANSPERVSALFGRIVLETLVEGLSWPPQETYTELLDLIERYFAPGAADEQDLSDGARPRPLDPEASVEAARWLNSAPEGLFRLFLDGSFHVTLSTEAGPFHLKSAQAMPIRDSETFERRPGLRLTMTLEPSVPPIVAPPGQPAPVMQIRLVGGGMFSPYSLFEPYALSLVDLRVDVRGLRKLQGFSDDGPLDLSRAFMPFGARPRNGSTFQFGALEMAAKAVTAVGLQVDWAGVPVGAGGFDTHYAAYGPDFQPPDPILHMSYLAADCWRPLGDGPLDMLPTPNGGTELSSHLKFSARVPGSPIVAATGKSQAEFQQRNTAGVGMVQCRLDCPEPVFGHSVYPSVLATAMRPGLLPFRKRPLPAEPYTPRIARIRLDYSAEDRIVIDAPGTARPDQRLIRVDPFGQTEIFPVHTDQDAGLFAPRLANGSIFFRIEGEVGEGELSLAFVMAEASHQRVEFPPTSVHWHYLTDRGWQALPDWAVEADSTDGFMRSGVVQLNVPHEASQRSTQMPGAGLWLALSADERLMAFPRLYRAAVNGVLVTRADTTAEEATEPMPTSWYLDPLPPGFAGVERLSASMGGRPAEAKTNFRVRVGEHLRHRKRGVTAQDIERLVLDAFPQVWKCKCFSTTEWRRNQPVPGAISVVVVPGQPADAMANPAQPRMFDVLTLRRIQAMLVRHCGPFNTIEVNNPSFERLQVRATVSFPRSRDEGSLVQRLKLDLSRYLSVWTADVPLDGFGWSLNVNDVGAFILGLDYVKSFAGLSILQLVENDNNTFRLIDTARTGQGPEVETIRCLRPWALAMPHTEHWIHPVPEAGNQRPEATGIGGLAVGQTLVVDEGT